MVPAGISPTFTTLKLSNTRGCTQKGPRQNSNTGMPPKHRHATQPDNSGKKINGVGANTLKILAKSRIFGNFLNMDGAVPRPFIVNPLVTPNNKP
ncbi:hypothetical protein DV965_17595, partial [Staphylococcus pseudintermedius]